MRTHSDRLMIATGGARRPPISLRASQVGAGQLVNACRTICGRGKHEEKFSLKMLDRLKRSGCTPPLWSPWKNVAAYHASYQNLPSASLAVSTAITFAFLA